MGNEITRVDIKRQVDKLGRIVIPKEYREFYHLNHNGEVFSCDRFYVNSDFCLNTPSV